MKRKPVLYLILILMVVGGGGIGSYYWYQGAHYVTTEDARIAADTYRIIPKIAGMLTDLNISDGDTVVADHVVGHMESTNLPTNLLDNAVLRSPISGTVLKTYAKPGEVVSPSQTIATIIDDKKLYVSANIEETALQRVKVGEHVQITVDAFPGKVLSGKVIEISKGTNSMFSLLPAVNTSGNFTKVTQRIPVKISLDQTDGLALEPGLNTTVKIEVKG